MTGPASQRPARAAFDRVRVSPRSGEASPACRSTRASTPAPAMTGTTGLVGGARIKKNALAHRSLRNRGRTFERDRRRSRRVARVLRSRRVARRGSTHGWHGRKTCSSTSAASLPTSGGGPRRKRMPATGEPTLRRSSAAIDEAEARSRAARHLHPPGGSLAGRATASSRARSAAAPNAGCRTGRNRRAVSGRSAALSQPALRRALRLVALDQPRPHEPEYGWNPNSRHRLPRHPERRRASTRLLPLAQAPLQHDRRLNRAREYEHHLRSLQIVGVGRNHRIARHRAVE